MSEEQKLPDSVVAEAEETVKADPELVPAPVERDPMPPVESRFMFVDIAALRAKQLRRGALARVPSRSEAEGETGPNPKLERIAMQEIENGLIVYEIPDPKNASADSAG